MIVIGLDVHKQSVTAVAVDEAGRPLQEKVVRVGSDELLGWVAELSAKRLWAVEDCRQLTGWLERQPLGVGEGVGAGKAEAATRRRTVRSPQPNAPTRARRPHDGRRSPE